METVVQIASSAALTQAYQRLLAGNWQRRTLDAVLTLLGQEIGTSTGALPPALRAILEPGRSRKAAAGNDAGVIEEIRHFRRHFHGSGLIPAVPAHLPTPRGGKRRARAEAAWTYLVLESLVRLKGDTGLFADTQSLLFLRTVEFMLPDLEAAGERAERDCLVNALYMHTFITWTHDPQRQAHHFFLQAVLMEHLSEGRLRQENLRYALNLTHLEDHSFLTKVQAYVFSLLDAGESAEAKRFLLRLYRHAPENDLSELQEMLDHVQAVCTARP